MADLKCGWGDTIDSGTWCVVHYGPGEYEFDHKHWHGTYTELHDWTNRLHTEGSTTVELWMGDIPVRTLGDVTSPNNLWVARREGWFEKQQAGSLT